MTFYQYPDYMYHHGVKGMKWGVRRIKEQRSAKKQAKKDYKSKRVKAYASHVSRTGKADIDFKKATADRTSALSENKKRYKEMKNSISDYYDPKITKHENKAERAKKNMEFYDGNKNMADAYRSSYDKHSSKATQYKQAKEWASNKNRYDFMESERKIINDYAPSYEKATKERQEAYTRSGEQLAKDLVNAKIQYKQAKKEAKKK